MCKCRRHKREGPAVKPLLRQLMLDFNDSDEMNAQWKAQMGIYFKEQAKRKITKEKKEHFNAGFGMKLKHLMMNLWDSNHSLLLFKKKMSHDIVNFNISFNAMFFMIFGRASQFTFAD